jgi:hypothetical protein
MALPDMVVDKPVFDGSQNGAWSRGHVCVRVASDIFGAVEECVLAALTGAVLLKIDDNLRPQPRAASSVPRPASIWADGVRPTVENTEGLAMGLDGLRSGC